MSTEQTALTPTASGPREGSLKYYLEQPGYRARFNEMLGKRSAQFMASIINVASATNFRNVEPRSIIAAAAVAATLDLPIDKNLGFAWIVPYGGKAQFQLGWKGVVQLAIRSGQYANMNAFTVNAEAVGGVDNIGEPQIIWENLDETKPAVGYAFGWRLTSGFSKIVYWSKEKVVAHAKKYSKAFKAGGDTPWKSDFDKMAMKTVVSNSLRQWGILSIEMRNAFERDQTAAIDIDAEPVYLDNDGESFGETNGTERASKLAEALKNEDQPRMREPGEEDEENASDQAGEPVDDEPPPGFTKPKRAK